MTKGTTLTDLMSIVEAQHDSINKLRNLSSGHLTSTQIKLLHDVFEQNIEARSLLRQVIWNLGGRCS